jgi:hypothetical protein
MVVGELLAAVVGQNPRRAKFERDGEVRRPAAEAEGQQRWRGHAYARKNAGAEQGGDVWARVRRRALLGFETIEKPPTDMTGRTHASVERRMSRRWKNRSVSRTVGAIELLGETRHRMV